MNRLEEKHKYNLQLLEKVSYESPKLLKLGKLSELTLGQNGSSFDGNNTWTQKGGGNDCREPHNCDDPNALTAPDGRPLTYTQ